MYSCVHNFTVFYVYVCVYSSFSYERSAHNQFANSIQFSIVAK